jgi:hypothetical protein
MHHVTDLTPLTSRLLIVVHRGPFSAGGWLVKGGKHLLPPLDGLEVLGRLDEEQDADGLINTGGGHQGYTLLLAPHRWVMVWRCFRHPCVYIVAWRMAETA